MLRLLLTAGLVASTGLAQVVINEFNYDDLGAVDDYEFVELYNAGAPVDISNWRVVGHDPQSPLYGGPGPDVFDVVISPGVPLILLTGQFYVIGSALVTNVNQVIPNTTIENENDSIELYDAANVLQDSVCYEMGSGLFGPHPIEGRGFFGDLATGNLTTTIARVFDGLDTNRNQKDFICCAVPTPGASNNVLSSALPYLDTFDAGTLPGDVPGWSRGFLSPKYIDPTIADSWNITAKVPSPQGGLAMALWDNTGGGNAAQLISVPQADVVVECYAWFQPTMSPVNPATSPYNQTIVVPNQFNVGDGEYWAVGVRGTTAANGNPTDVPGNYYSSIALGVAFRPAFVTGLAWVHYRTTTYSRLYLVDLKDGQIAGSPNNANFTILGGPIDILPGVNDGWQRLRLHVQGNVVVGNFGGTYGCDDGLRISGTTTTTDPGQVYIAYREAVLSNASSVTQGPQGSLFDAIDIHAPTTSKSYFGVGSPLSNSLIPQTDADGLAILGSTGFAIKGSNLVPLGFSYLAIGLNIFPGGFQIPGAPPGAKAYFFPLDFEFFMFPDINGNASQTIPIPCNPAFASIPFAAQIASFDPALGPFALPIGVSQPMLMTLGR